MKVNYFISKWKEGLPSDFPKEGHLDMGAVPRKGDSVYVGGYEFKVDGSVSWMLETGMHSVIHIPRLFLT